MSRKKCSCPVVARLLSAEPRLDLITSGQWRYQAHFTKRHLTAVMTLSLSEILTKPCSFLTMPLGEFRNPSFFLLCAISFFWKFSQNPFYSSSWHYRRFAICLYFRLMTLTIFTDSSWSRSMPLYLWLRSANTAAFSEKSWLRPKVTASKNKPFASKTGK